MNEKSGGKSMSLTDAQRRANKKYDQKSYDIVTVKLPKGTKDKILSMGYTVNGLVNELIKQKLEEKE